MYSSQVSDLHMQAVCKSDSKLTSAFILNVLNVGENAHIY